ncbi:alpha/beta-hydrolase [Hortaea werneckii]|nr:alpha/beta-hydrolase [Hortaea werneckii]
MFSAVLVAAFGACCFVHAHPPGWKDDSNWNRGGPDGRHNGVTGHQGVDSDLTIITHDDLYGNMSSRTGAAMVLSTPMTAWQAADACMHLGERLWHPSQSNGDFLRYLSHESQDGPYWVSGHQGPVCKTTTARGVQGVAHCNEHLPVLCTQSAPLSNLTYTDNSTTWRTTISSSDQTFTGFRDRFSFRFEGIRYAPQPEAFTYSSLYNGSGHHDALSFGSQCVQAGNLGSTDCLFLNVWTPYLPTSGQTPPEKLKPVMFWIHGGGFTGGTGSDPTFDGGSLVARGDVVVVTINYRLGTLGFLALEDGVTNGNFGLADQITALDWVHEHIKAFGGDPNRITIFGQSAGGASVRALLASPKAIGKFAAAIPQSSLAGSGYAHPYSDYYTIPEEVAVAADPILAATGCSNATSAVDCLRGVNPYALTNLTTSARFLVQDGTYLVGEELQVTGKGPAAHVPVMMGFMRDDGAAFISYPAANATLSSSLASNGFTNLSIVDTFPTPDGMNQTLNIFNTTSLVATDSFFRCLDEATAYSAALHNVLEPIYFYEFNRSYQLSTYNPNAPVCTPPIEPGYPYGNPDAEYFKCHSGELYYAFGTIVFNGLPIRDDYDIPMSQFTVDTWSSFARTYDPNPDSLYLEARGFTNTTAEIARSGSRWAPVDENHLTLRLMEYPSTQAPFDIYASQEQCRALGFGIDYYERS